MKTIEEEIIKKMSLEFASKLENLIINGLKLKGFEFENKIELEEFIKTRCRRTDNIDFKEHIYYIDDVPFFLHKYGIELSPVIEHGNEIKMYSNFGSYKYL